MPKPSFIQPRTVVVFISVLLLAIGLFLGARTITQVQFARQEQAGLPSAARSATSSRPTAMTIAALSINAAPIVPLGLNSDGSLQTPAGEKEVGWYSGGAAPGENGTAIMVGHLDSTFGSAIFWHLKNLKAGDVVSISRSDGHTVEFVVDHLASYSFDNFPDQEVYGATPYPSLRLLTCAGTYSRKTHHYSENLVVYARLTTGK
jgi:sortase (surface protein transpeptidase)